MPVKVNEMIKEIVKEVTMLKSLEQQVLLTRLRLKRFLKKRISPIAKTPKGMKIPTMEQIDKWEHESRKVKGG